MSECRLLTAGALAATVILMCSCAAVPMPILANAGVNMAQANTGSFVSGSMQCACSLPMDPVRQACLEAAAALQYKVRLQSSSASDCTYFLIPNRGDTIRIRIVEHTPAVSTISIRVGLLGDQNLSRFVLSEVERRLPPRQ